MLIHVLLTFALSFLPASAQSRKKDPEVEKFCKTPSPPPQLFTVVRIGDGDTITVKDQASRSWQVRLKGIDTPEAWYQKESQGIWAKRAKEYLQSKLPVGSEVTLSFERQPCDGLRRLIAQVRFRGEDLNRDMLVKGFAVNYCIPPNTELCEDYGFEAQRNFDQKLGIFAEPTLEIPYIWRQKVSAKTRGSFSYWVGDLQTKEVIRSERMDEIPVGRRAIFYSKFWIRSPFIIAE